MAVTAPRVLPLDAVHRDLGASFVEAAGTLVPRHYGDPAAEYDAARTEAAVVDRSERALIRLHGRDPLRMIQGLISNDLTNAPADRAVYAAVLTAKGRMVADVRAFRRAGGEVWLDADGAARDALSEHLRRFVPPLFARQDDLTETWGDIAALGPGARGVIERALGAVPGSMPEEGLVERPLPRSSARGEGSAEQASAIVLRTLFAGVDGYEVLAPAASLRDAWDSLIAAGARPAGQGALEVLRIEAGRPRWGAELTSETIPLEAGLRQRAISETKGCYTGQEVIVRILHRGHVNWLLRGLRLGDVPTPAPDSPLFSTEGRRVGRLTSACNSPRFGETIGLGYVRREVEPPDELRLGEDGSPVEVVSLPFAATSG